MWTNPSEALHFHVFSKSMKSILFSIEVIDVVSDEDLEMQELIKEEKRRRSGKPPKKDKQVR